MAGAYPAHLHGAATAGKANKFTVGSASYECSSTTYTGQLTAKTTELTLEPVFGGCLRGGTEPQTITWNGCDYILRSGEGSETEFPVTTDLECPGAKGIEIHGYATSGTHGEAKSNCNLTIAEQTGLKGLTYTKEAGSNSFVLEGTVEGLAAQAHGECAFGLTVNPSTSQHVNATVLVTGRGHFTAPAYPAGLHGTVLAGKENTITAGSFTYKCSSTTYSGSLTEKTTDLTLEPKVSGCLQDASAATITWNGCDYVFRSGEGTEAEFPVTTDLDCPEGKRVEIHSYSNEANHKSGSSSCTITFAEQTGLKGITYTKEVGTNSFILEGILEGLKMETHGACSFGFTINQTASQHINTTVLVTDLEHFTADSYPAHLHGTAIAGKENSFTAGESVYKCSSSTYTGELTAKSTDLTLQPTFSGCLQGASPATITWNGCDYVFHSGEGTETEFPVTTDLDCPEGKRIEIHSYSSEANHKSGSSSCTITYAEQTGLKGITYTKEAGTNSFVLEGALEGLKLEMHGACSFGFTLNQTTSQHVNTTVQATK